MSDAIIHSGDKAGDTQFIESYAKRQARQPTLKLERVRSSCRKGGDSETTRRFRELYVRGATNERIALDLGLSDRVINSMRRELDLPVRRDETGEDGDRTENSATFSFDLPKELHDRMNAHVSTCHCSHTHHDRALIKRDLNGR